MNSKRKAEVSDNSITMVTVYASHELLFSPFISTKKIFAASTQSPLVRLTEMCENTRLIKVSHILHT